MTIEELAAEVERLLSESRGWWRTSDGRVLRIAEMGDEHLKNVIRLFEAGWGEHPKVLELKDERTRRC